MAEQETTIDWDNSICQVRGGMARVGMTKVGRRESSRMRIGRGQSHSIRRSEPWATLEEQALAHRRSYRGLLVWRVVGVRSKMVMGEGELVVDCRKGVRSSCVGGAVVTGKSRQKIRRDSEIGKRRQSPHHQTRRASWFVVGSSRWRRWP
jgi:hypothetical protein